MQLQLIPEEFDVRVPDTWEWLPEIIASGKDSYDVHGSFWTNNYRNAVCWSFFLQLAHGDGDIEPIDRAARRAPQLYLDAQSKVSTGFSYLSTGDLDGKFCISKRIAFHLPDGSSFGVKQDFTKFMQSYQGEKFSVGYIDSCSAWTTIEKGIDLLLKHHMRKKSVLVVEVTTRVGGASRKFPKNMTILGTL